MLIPLNVSDSAASLGTVASWTWICIYGTMLQSCTYLSLSFGCCPCPDLFFQQYHKITIQTLNDKCSINAMQAFYLWRVANDELQARCECNYIFNVPSTVHIYHCIRCRDDGTVYTFCNCVYSSRSLSLLKRCLPGCSNGVAHAYPSPNQRTKQARYSNMKQIPTVVCTRAALRIRFILYEHICYSFRVCQRHSPRPEPYRSTQKKQWKLFLFMIAIQKYRRSNDRSHELRRQTGQERDDENGRTAPLGRLAHGLVQKIVVLNIICPVLQRLSMQNLIRT